MVLILLSVIIFNFFPLKTWNFKESVSDGLEGGERGKISFLLFPPTPKVFTNLVPLRADSVGSFCS